MALKFTVIRQKKEQMFLEHSEITHTKRCRHCGRTKESDHAHPELCFCGRTLEV